MLREIYPVYVKSLPDNNDNVPILTYYDRSSIMRQRLANEGNHNNSIDTERYVHDGDFSHSSLASINPPILYLNMNS